MKRLMVLFLSGLLIGCGTVPSERQTAQEFYDATRKDRDNIAKLQYGQSMDVMHAEVLTDYAPVFDIYLNGHEYAVEKFYIDSSYTINESYFVALYKDQKLVAVAPEDEFQSQWPFKKLDPYTVKMNKDANACLLNWYPEKFERIVSKIEAKKIKLDKNNLIKTEEQIDEYIGYLTDKKENAITVQDGMELAVMSPFYVLFGPAAVAGAAVTAPLTVPPALWVKNQASTRAENMPSRMKEVRAVPLGISVEEIQAKSENIVLTRVPQLKVRQTSCDIATYQLKKSAMSFEVLYFEKDNHAYLRVYSDESIIL